MTDAVENQYIEMAYARVSSKNQTLARQEASILNAVPDLKAKYFYKDKWTGKEFDRPEYTRLKEKVEELTEVNPNINLRLTVHELDRLGRDYKEIQKEVYWFRARGVKIRFLDIPEQLISETLGIAGDMIIDIIVLVKAFQAEQELEDKKKRCREGIAEAKAKGTKFGRQAIEIDEEQFKKQADRAIARYITHNEAMNILHLKPYVYWKWIKQFYPNYKPNKKKVIKG